MDLMFLAMLAFKEIDFSKGQEYFNQVRQAYDSIDEAKIRVQYSQILVFISQMPCIEEHEFEELIELLGKAEQEISEAEQTH